MHRPIQQMSCKFSELSFSLIKLQLLLGLHHHHQNYKKKVKEANAMVNCCCWILPNHNYRNSKPQMKHTQFADHLTGNKYSLYIYKTQLPNSSGLRKVINLVDSHKCLKYIIFSKTNLSLILLFLLMVSQYIIFLLLN